MENTTILDGGKQMLSNAIVAAFIVALVMTTVVPAVLLLILGLLSLIHI